MVEISSYYLLIDAENKGAVAGSLAGRIYEYVTWNGREWVPFDMMQYFFDEGAKYDFYKELDKDLAQQMIQQQSKDFEVICNNLQKLGALAMDTIDYSEETIVRAFINSGSIFFNENKQILSEYPRLSLAVEKFNEFVHFERPNSLYLLREWRNLCPLAVEYFEKQHKTGLIDDERYLIISNYLNWKINVLTEEQVRIVNGEEPDSDRGFWSGLIGKIKGN